MKKLFHAGNLIILFSAGTLCFVFILIFSFMRQDLLTVDRDFYKEERQMNEYIQSVNNANKLGNEFRILKNERNLILHIPENIASGLITGNVLAYFPSAPNMDQTISLSPTTDGTYTLTINNPKQLNFQIKVSLQDETSSYVKIFNL